MHSCNNSKGIEKFSHLVWLEWSDHHITCKIGATQMFLMKIVEGKGGSATYLVAVVFCKRSSQLEDL